MLSSTSLKKNRVDKKKAEISTSWRVPSMDYPAYIIAS